MSEQQDHERVRAVLWEDVIFAKESAANSPGEASLRSLIRAYFAFLEGDLFAFKQIILSMEKHLVRFSLPDPAETRMVIFSDEEKAMLKEYSYDLASGGKARKTSYHPRLADNIKFALRMFHKGVRIESDIDYNSDGWNCLLSSQKIRNRITHPKSTLDLEVSREDLQTAETGIEWYEETVDRLWERASNESPFRLRRDC